MNFLGLGFNFGAQDAGLQKSLKTTSSGLADIGKSVTMIGMQSAKMAMKPPNFGPAVSQMSSMLGDMKLHTTMLEAYGVQANKISSAGLAGLNKTEPQLKKLRGLVSSTAFSMNTDLGGVTNSMVALTQAGFDVTKGFAGFKSFKEFQKVMQVTGADAGKTAGAMRTLMSQYGMTEEEVGKLMKTNLALGKRMNIGREAMQQFGSSISYLTEKAAVMGKSFDRKQLEQYTLGTTKMTGALVKAGATTEEAQVTVQKMNDALLGGQTNMERVFTGIDKNLGPGVEGLTESFGSVEAAMDMMKRSPDEFALKMAQTMDNVRKVTGDDQVFDRMRQQVSAAFGPGVLKAMDKGGATMQKALADANKPVGDTTDAFADVSKAWKDGRTMAERFAIAQDRLVTRMKKIQGVMSDTTYLQKYRQNTEELYKTLNKTAKKGGPLGKMTTMLIEMRTKGIGGALSAHSKWGMALAEASNQFGPILRTLPGLGMAFAALASPITLVAGAIAGLFFVFKDLEKGDKSIVAPWIKKLKKEAPKILEAVKNAFTKALSIIGKIITYVIDKIDFNKVGQVLGSILQKAADLALVILAGAFKLGEKILVWLASIDWGAIGQKVGYYLAGAFELAFKLVAKVVMNLPKILLTALDKIRDAILGIIDGIRDYLVNKFPSAAKPIAFIAEMFKVWYRAVFAVYKFVVKIFVGAIKLAFKIIKGAIQAVVWVVEKLIGAVKAVAGAAKWVADKVGGFFSGIGSAVGGALSKVGGALGSIGSSISGFFSSSKKKTQTYKIDIVKQMEELRKKMQEKMDKAAANQIKNVDEITDKTSAGVKKQFDLLIASGKKVITHEGVVINAADSVVQYTKKASGEVTKMVYEANKLRFAQIKSEPFQEAKKLMADLRAESKHLLKNENYSSEKMDEYWKKRKAAVKAFQDQYGVTPSAMAGAAQYIETQLALEKDLINGLSGASEGYRKALMANQDQLATNIAEEWQHIRAMEVKGEISKEKAAEMYKAIDLQVTKSREMAKEIAPILEGNFAQAIKGIEGTGEKSSVMAARVAKVWMENYKGQVADTLKTIPKASEGARAEIKAVYDKLAETQRAQMKLILENDDLTAKERERRVKELNVKFEGAHQELTAKLKSENKALMVGATEDTLKAVKDIASGFEKMAKDTKVKTSEAAGEIQKTLGVSADEASRMVGTISNLKPAKFKKNMKIIQREFKKFMEDFVSHTQQMAKDSAKDINAFWESSKAGWENQTKLLEKWSNDSAVHIKKYWTNVIAEAGKALFKFLDLSGQVKAALTATVGGFNILDLLAGPDKIRSWAQSVTAALATALRGGSAVEALTMASYDQAIQMYNRATATADGGGEGGSASPPSTRAARQGALNMQRAIHSPDWTRESPIKTALDDVNSNLKTLIKAQEDQARTVRGPRQRRR